ncbi:hypothetical protein BIV60_03730 [Bacillus sp. MUM 116]|nr:hypothetical protein BIV60_03730 [Bacillus sp. MUM 116]
MCCNAQIKEADLLSANRVEPRVTLVPMLIQSIGMGVFYFYKKAVLKYIVDFLTLLIGAEGTKTPAGVRGRGDPTGA